MQVQAVPVLTCLCLNSNRNNVTMLLLQFASPNLIITQPPQQQGANALQLLCHAQ